MKKQKIAWTPISIVIGSIIIAAGLIVAFGGSVATEEQTQPQPREDEVMVQDLTVRDLEETDPLRGDISAPVTIIEFSDFECPFCARVHPSLRRLVSERPGDVNWTYRHIALSGHAQARSAAIASECVADLAGDVAFWTFADRVFAEQSSLGDDLYLAIANDLAIDIDAFNSCRDDEAVSERIDEDMAEAAAAGGRGTPFMVFVTAQGNMIPVTGALPYEVLNQVVDEALKN